jgi:hypothetical protein
MALYGKVRPRSRLAFYHHDIVYSYDHAMHDCFRIPEISRMICSELLHTESQEALASLAQTCRTLEDPALEKLWYYQEGLVPVMKTFPSDLWEIKWLNNKTTLVGTLEVTLFVSNNGASISSGQWLRRTGHDF